MNMAGKTKRQIETYLNSECLSMYDCFNKISRKNTDNNQLN